MKGETRSCSLPEVMEASAATSMNPLGDVNSVDLSNSVSSETKRGRKPLKSNKNVSREKFPGFHAKIGQQMKKRFEYLRAKERR